MESDIGRQGSDDLKSSDLKYTARIIQPTPGKSALKKHKRKMVALLKTRKKYHNRKHVTDIQNTESVECLENDREKSSDATEMEAFISDHDHNGIKNPTCRAQEMKLVVLMILMKMLQAVGRQKADMTLSL